jgi:hypothetical protein
MLTFISKGRIKIKFLFLSSRARTVKLLFVAEIDNEYRKLERF